MSVSPPGLRSLVVGTTPTRSKIALTAPSGGPILSQIGITVPYVGANAIVVQYSTLPGSTPKTNSNFLAIWESTIVPWTVPPMATQDIVGDTQQGSVSFSDLSIQNKAYIIGYAVGPNITDICATATIFVGGQPAQYFSTSIGIALVTDDTLVLQYSCSPGYQPQPSNNWVGLWQGAASPYYSGNPLHKTSVTSASSQGTVVMNGLTLSFGTQYTLVYFMGPNVTDAAAILTFTTSG